MPLKKATGGFHPVPGYSVFYQVLTRMDPEAFGARLTDWLQGQGDRALWNLTSQWSRVALSEMEEGPPKTACRGSLQTTTSCEGKELSW
ncbi:hypothetical protein [Verrucomicrobium sp. 3C]|uniref:hypothetical protein n=1 Tax=Verrucomicrobium sp. 3C TaxID=1134055 RepID=UPI001E62435B|nr:hypothetical protein [Verrucomicrobium sp. 3C]